MIKTSKAPEEEITYFGFDMFEPLSPEQSSCEYSGVYSNPPSLEEVKTKIESETKAKILLFKGDSKDTIPKNLESLPIMDLIYIDGGHSLPTIESDWNNLKQLMGPETVTFFDDYFPDISDMGCKSLSDTIGQEYQVKVHDGIDSYGPSGESPLRIQLMSVRKAEALEEEVWKRAQTWEREWWGTCQNTYYEQKKQLDYAQKMELTPTPIPSTPYSFNLGGRSVLDVGGGPTSLLLKCRNVGRAKVIDPLSFPAWVAERYKEAGIEYEEIAAEDMNEKDWDEVWIYNVLQHSRNPYQVVKKAREAGELVRLFEWLDTPPSDGHPHRLTEVDLDQWLGSKGSVDGNKYYGVFQKLAKSSDGIVHFALTSGELIYPYYLSIMSALKTQKAGRFVLWAFSKPKGKYWPLLEDRVQLRILAKPDLPALKKVDPYCQLVTLKDYFEWKILYHHGGLFLDLDTFCVKDVMYLNQDGEHELVLGDMVEEKLSDHYPLFNNAAVMATPCSSVIAQMLSSMEDILARGDYKWGDIGPKLLTEFARLNLHKIKAMEYGAFDGAGEQKIMGLLYQKGTKLWDQATILHLYAKSVSQYKDFTEEFIRDSDILFAHVVRNTLTAEEWAPTLAKGISCPQAVGEKGDPGPPGIAVKKRGRRPPLEELKKHKRFHLPGLQHVPTNKEDALCCAYSQKVIKMAKMLKSLGHTVFFYGLEGSKVECDQYIQVATKDVLKQAYGNYNWHTHTFKHNINDIAYTTFDKNAIKKINERKSEYDYLLLPWNGHKRIYEAISTKFIDDPNKLHMSLESGIGYRRAIARYRVYESYAWMHYVRGLETENMKNVNGDNYGVVIPNYFDPSDFEYCEDKGDYFLQLGRVVPRKGIAVAKEIVEAIGAKLIVAGQLCDDPREKVNLDSPNIEYVGIADVEMRKQLLKDAKALFVPTQYIGPFEGVSIEAAFAGTPVITTDWGAFSENVIHGVTGFRCRTRDHYIWAAKNIDKIKPADCYKWAMDNFTLDRIKYMYEEYFNMLMDVKYGQDFGWHTEHPERTELDWLRRVYPNDRIIINSSGNVGIPNTSPSEKLHVVEC